jgi:hypothetical protein
MRMGAATVDLRRFDCPMDVCRAPGFSGQCRILPQALPQWPKFLTRFGSFHFSSLTSVKEHTRRIS